MFAEEKSQIQALTIYAFSIAVLVVAMNIISIIQLLLNKRSTVQKFLPDEVILTSLCFTNLFVGIAAFTDLIFYIIEIQLSSWILLITNYVMRFSMISSLLHILFLTFERLLSIRFPIWHRNHMNKRKTNLTIIVIWFTSIMPVFGDVKRFVFLKTLAVLMLICNVVLVPVYVYIYCVVKRTGNSTTKSKRKPSKLERKSTFTCSAIVLSFFVCTVAPIIDLLMMREENPSYKEGNITHLIMFSLVILRSLFDPLVYILRNKVYNCRKRVLHIESTGQLFTVKCEDLSNLYEQRTHLVEIQETCL